MTTTLSDDASRTDLRRRSAPRPRLQPPLLGSLCLERHHGVDNPSAATNWRTGRAIAVAASRWSCLVRSVETAGFTSCDQPRSLPRSRMPPSRSSHPWAWRPVSRTTPHCRPECSPAPPQQLPSPWHSIVWRARFVRKVVISALPQQYHPVHFTLLTRDET